MNKLSKLHRNSEGLGKPVLIGLIALAVLAVGAIGYVIGSNQAEADAKKKYDAQTQQLQSELDQAKDTAGGALEEGQDAVEEGQQTLESLQAENTQLKATIEEQNQKIADLEDQLEEANSTTPPAEQ